MIGLTAGAANGIQALTGAGGPHHTCERDKFWDSTEGCVACWSGSGAHTYEQEKTESVICTTCGSMPPYHTRECAVWRSAAFGNSPQPTTASDILHQALEAVKDRDKRYSDASAVFNTAIELFRTYTLAREGKDVTAQDTAIFNICQKIARIAHGEGDPDNWRDIAGYAALAAQVVREEG